MAHTSLWRNPKFLDLCDTLGMCPQHVAGHLERMWHDAYDHCLPRGKVDPKHVERMACWCGNEGVLLSALQKSGFLTEKKSGLYFYKFLKHAPDYVRKRNDRKKKRQGKCPDNGGRCPDKIRSTEHNRTQQNRTKQNKTDESIEDGDAIRLNDLDQKRRDIVSWLVRDCALDDAAKAILPGLVAKLDVENLQVGCLGRLVGECRKSARNPSAYIIQSIKGLIGQEHMQ